MTTLSDVAGTARATHRYFRFGRRAADRAPSRELLLAIACCRWPRSEPALAAIRAACSDAIDWPAFLRVVRRQRIDALVHHALLAARIDIPTPVAHELASRAQKISRRNIALVAETVRLQRTLDAAQIPVMVLKGIALAQLAYGSLELKQALDIDLLVPPDRAETALQLLERAGFVLLAPAPHLSEQQRRAIVRHGKDVELVHRGRNVRVDLQWRLAGNPLLLKGVDAYSPTQDVSLSDELSIRTLAEQDLFAYLCVHGAHHAWSRLKWLADVNALMAAKDDGDIVRLYRYAQARGAGLCAGQALLLCHRLLVLKLPAALAVELPGNGRLEKLTAVALRAMASPAAGTGRGMAGVIRSVLAQFLLGQGWTFFAAQCRIASVGLVDVIRVPLAPPLHFLYPILRLPLWLWRRLKRRH